MFRPILALTVTALAVLTIAAPTTSHGGWISLGPNQRAKEASLNEPSDLVPSSRQTEQLTTSEKQYARCPDTDQCSFVENFKWKDGNRWTLAHDYSNGISFDCWWSKDRVFFNTKKKKLKLSVAKHLRHGKPYASGHTLSKKWHGYGCYEVRMRPANQEGLITTFFSYTGRFDAAPGAAKAHNEVDVEFVYKKQYKKIMFQANYFTNGQGGHEHLIPLWFNPVRKFHNYAFKWTSKGITWYADGKKVYTATKNTPKISRGPHKIMMNLWPVSPASAGWGGNYQWKGSKVATYQAIRFTKGEDCKIYNRF